MQWYEHIEKLGQGGTGAVHIARGRLTGQQVALKRVRTETKHLEFASRGSISSEQLALTQEFTTLASLRHPNIVSVLDFAFEVLTRHHPFERESISGLASAILHDEPSDGDMPPLEAFDKTRSLYADQLL